MATRFSRREFAALATIAGLAAIPRQAFAQQDEASEGHGTVADGIAIYLGVLPSDIIAKDYGKNTPEYEMHEGPPRRNSFPSRLGGALRRRDGSPDHGCRSQGDSAARWIVRHHKEARTLHGQRRHDLLQLLQYARLRGVSDQNRNPPRGCSGRNEGGAQVRPHELQLTSGRNATWRGTGGECVGPPMAARHRSRTPPRLKLRNLLVLMRARNQRRSCRMSRTSRVSRRTIYTPALGTLSLLTPS